MSSRQRIPFLKMIFFAVDSYLNKIQSGGPTPTLTPTPPQSPTSTPTSLIFLINGDFFYRSADWFFLHKSRRWSIGRGV